MSAIAALWLPILLSAVAVFFLSYMMWMVFPHHKGDWPKVKSEDDLMEAIAKLKVAPGQYSFPFCKGAEDMKDPQFIARMEKGPAGMLLIRPTGPMNMGKTMGVSFGYNLIIGIFVAYIASFGLAASSTFSEVFRLTGTVAFLGFAGALGWNPIWFCRSWSSTFREILDGLAYGLVTGAIFASLW
ncbi:MAG: hypothetical protein V3W41_11975 [Planctomycetota bacterium]